MGCRCSKDRPAKSVGEDVRDVYRIGKLLGSGAFGQVRECMKRDTKELFAMKIMEKSSSEKGHWSNESMFRREVQVLGLLNHPHIIRYYDFYEDRHFLYCVMEKCDGGELFESILRHRTFPERRAAQLCYQMLKALAYVHACGVVHRDIKAENFLFKTTNPDSPLKLIDFGMSARISKEQVLTDVCGSPHYLSPELIRRKYSFKADVWALGVLIYLMLFGRYPFDGNNTSAIVKVILTKKIDWQCGEIRPSERAIHFMKSLLQRNPEKRPTAAEAVQHAWLAGARRQAELQAQIEKEGVAAESLLEEETSIQQQQQQQPGTAVVEEENLMPNVRSA
eukprot:Protomagalhaensia_sp_Gyna_25__632@NODE_1297_length_1965_cov_52_862928_g1036_i0_p1_GENE_NODE_1297_length_1965_cov_52_862928_g1036_i0NODE_1297_length_1965_cov_52_862928_g1036_i0_p1_ORF_typecomplete_len336_score43_93Pkinase/PF00069_25/7_1e77Pkinase_Tyr/PF07714_17/4e48Kinaselike/PF14531_6/5_6e19Kdo/PF06293_14/2_2e12Kdo/PF06293_14/7e03Pkinase_fungal/PF17667_1/1_6e09APH/PF01636_23/1e05APH/PF01636_23/2_8e03YrbLPhoP_reg/PF10707_9/1_4e06YrbLPhoP_reg/PF10707_9/1_5e03RIO1/PF01163_22/2_4e06WaaY/PF06176_11/7